MKIKPILPRPTSKPRGTLLALALLLMSGILYFAVAQPKAEEKREMLSKHQTVAQFAGISYHRCMGLTSLCPDKCGQSGDMATFRIVKYLAYEKPGQYGDGQQKQFQFLVQDNMKHLKVSAETKAAVDALKPGDYVLLDWQHDYVSKDGANYPERTVTQLKRITKEEAEKLAGSLDQPDKDKP
jgi:hypothetical protein